MSPEHLAITLLHLHISIFSWVGFDQLYHIFNRTTNLLVSDSQVVAFPLDEAFLNTDEFFICERPRAMEG